MLKFVFGIVALGLLCHFVGTAWLFDVWNCLSWAFGKLLVLFSQTVHRLDRIGG